MERGREKQTERKTVVSRNKAKEVETERDEEDKGRERGRR